MNVRLQKITALYVIILMLTFNFAHAQYQIPSKPKIQTSIYDYSSLLSPQEASALEQKLIRYSDSTSTQIVIAIINSTKGEYINYLATNWAQEWGIGKSKKDNGVFILLAKNDRKINISTGYGVEHLLTDKMCSRIIQESIIPFFKKNDYYGGLNSGSTHIFKVLTGEFKASSSPQQSSVKFEKIIMLIFIFIILILILKNKKNRGNKNGGKRHPTSLLDAILLSSLGRGNFSGSSSGSFGSGGFGGGFGGGGFGGGGASGGW